MYAGAARIDITPTSRVSMDGMIRAHDSDGIHDPLYARALVISNSSDLADQLAIVALDLCAISSEDAHRACLMIAERSGLNAERIVLAPSHTHSGPATFGFFCERENEYSDLLLHKVCDVVLEAMENRIEVMVGYGRGDEQTVSNYRRFKDADGKIVMFWERDPSNGDMEVLGTSDPELGLLQFVDARDPSRVIATLVNHAGHPNVMSGENYMLSADYPGVMCRILDERFGGISIFTNGAQGSVDIDNWKYRDWDGMEQIGRRLADAAGHAAEGIVYSLESLRVGRYEYDVPSRKISDRELSWAKEILKETGGKLQPIADGVGDDYKAVLFKNLREIQDTKVHVSQISFAIGDTAYLTVPGELFTEIGKRIKNESPFRHTHIIGLANGYIGYIPTREAIVQGGYEVETRDVHEVAGETIETMSMTLLDEVFSQDESEGDVKL
jgi:hypothetical protein